MKTIAIGSIFVLFAIVAGIATTAPAAFADHATASVSTPAGTSVPGCEETDECFIPATVTVDVGGEVTWSNDDSAAHTVTSGTAAVGPDGNFDSSLFMAGTTFSWSPEEVGTYPYFCMVHPWMVGTVIVQEVGMEDKDDDHMDDDHTKDDDHMDDGMMMGEASAHGMLPDGTEVEIYASAPTAGEMMEIKVEFDDSEHVNYDVVVMQNGEEVLSDMGAHEHAGKGTHMTAPLDSADPVDVTIIFQGYGVNAPFSGETGEVVFTNVVPEFGTIAMMVLGVAIVSIIAVTAKTRVIPRL